MKFTSVLGLLGLSALSQAGRTKRDYVNNDYYVLHLDDSIAPQDVGQRLGLEHQGELEGLTDHHIFSAPKSVEDIVVPELKERKRRRRDVGGNDILDGVLLAKKQEPHRRLSKRIIPPRPAGLPLEPRLPQSPVVSAVEKQTKIMRDLDISDPIFKDQWHLFNSVQVGHDVNVTGVWLDGVTGKNVTVAIIDDGLDMYSNDLKDNYFAEGSYDFNEHDPEPKPTLSDDRHGTRCAGEVAAVRNDVCGLGVAYDSKIAGIRILSGDLTNADEAEALIYQSQLNNIYSCSWGPQDDGRHMEAPDIIVKRAMLKGVQDGRGGLGSIYVFASGNGASSGDNCNFDGYTNSIYSVTVGAVDRAGQHPFYSEHCSANLVVTYSSGSGSNIATTDVGENKCSDSHGGTSAAAPLAAGIFALVLQVRPELSWRDIQYLAMETAVKIDDGKAEWQETSIGKQFSHTFGYGKIDTYGIVERARTWDLVKPQAWYFSPWIHVKKHIPEGDKGLHVSFEVTEDMLKEANLERVEHVTVTMNVNHTRRGDLSVDLVSPDNIISHIATDRQNDDFDGGYEDWTFMSVVHWGEKGVGEWTIIVKDSHKNEHQGAFIDWHLKLWGESIDPDKAMKLPMPNENDDDDHDVIISTTVTATASTATVPPSPEKTHDDSAPAESSHPPRPTKPKPSGTKEAEATGTSDEAEETPTSTEESSWISWLPSFGASKTAQIWIYGAVGLIVVFCIGLGVYLYIARRRRLRNDTRSNYEFEMLDEEEGEGLNNPSGEKLMGGAAGGAGGRGNRRTRGGELYDAFAGGSDDEGDDFDRYSDREGSTATPPSKSGGNSSGGVPEDDDAEHFDIGEESDDDDDRRPLR